MGLKPCRFCGGKIRDGALVCSECGAANPLGLRTSPGGVERLALLIGVALAVFAALLVAAGFLGGM
jgi:hypothetical protein